MFFNFFVGRRTATAEGSRWQRKWVAFVCRCWKKTQYLFRRKWIKTHPYRVCRPPTLSSSAAAAAEAISLEAACTRCLMKWNYSTPKNEWKKAEAASFAWLCISHCWMLLVRHLPPIATQGDYKASTTKALCVHRITQKMGGCGRWVNMMLLSADCNRCVFAPEKYSYYTYDDSDVFFSHSVYVRCFPAMMWGMLWETFVIVTSLSY